MADNVAITPGLGATVAADEVGGALYQRCKIVHGVDGVATDVSTVSPLPVTLANGTVPSHAVTNAGTFEVQVTGVVDVVPAIPSALSYVPVRLSTGSAFAEAGTEYDEGATDAAITGTAMMWEDTSDTLRAVSAAKPLPVAIITGAGTGGTSITDDAAFTPAVTSVNPVGGMFDDVAPDSVNEGDAGIVRMSANRNLYVTVRDAAGNERGLNIDASGQLAVHHAPQTSGGLSIFRSIDLDETEEEVKGTAGQIYQIWFTNAATSTRWLKIYNATAANVTVGSTTPVITLGLPGNTADNISGVLGSDGIAFGTAITVAATTGFADADTGAPGANEVFVNIFYK